MKVSRRGFINTLAAGAALSVLPKSIRANDISVKPSKDRFDPWLEIDPEALKYNVKQLYEQSGNRPVLAVVKNNGYGLGTENIASILEDMPEIAGFADVKTQSCISLRQGGVKKPILLMGMPSDNAYDSLVDGNIQVAIYTQDVLKNLTKAARGQQKVHDVHIYVDTGMSRMGVPYHKALPFVKEVNSNSSMKIIGSFMGFTEDADFDKEQLTKFVDLAKVAKDQSYSMGKLHAASSNAIFHFPQAALDMVRPGIGIYGAYPTYFKKEKEIKTLRVAYKLKARIVRVEQLRKGDGVSYGRNYIAEKPTWIATLPIGHADGYLRKAVGNAKVFINQKLYPVIGAVSASHTIIEIGDEEKVKIGDEAILVGPDHAEVHPNHLSDVTGVSVYDVLMHMNAQLPKIITTD